MEKIEASLITTVYNEEENIENFLNSVLAQTKRPYELIIVDACSTDATASIVNKFKRKYTFIKLIRHKSNRSLGRNIAVKNSSTGVIACTDVGCILDKNWFEKITEEFKDKNIDVVSGYYRPLAKNIFEECLSTYTCVMEDKLDPKTYLPSSRSIAFRKTVWGKVKGYPEYLNTCEDLVFASNLKKQYFKFKFKKDAIVYWPQRENVFDAFLQFYNYALGDGKARYFRSTTPLLFLRFVLLFILLFFLGSSFISFNTFGTIVSFGFIGYCLFAINKNLRYINNWKAIFILPLLQIVSDAAVFLGTTKGIIESINRHRI